MSLTSHLDDEPKNVPTVGAPDISAKARRKKKKSNVTHG